jgi:hypothetical protein
MNDGHLSKTDIERIAALKKERADVLALPPQDALNRILEYRQPAALVHSFSEEDFYFLIHDIGPEEDALPLLSLASAKQLDFILDREIWRKDRMDNQAITLWFDLMLHADAKRFVNWLIREKADLLEFYLSRNIEMKVRDHDQELSDFTEDFFTLDNVLYVRIIEDNPDSADILPDSESGRVQNEDRRQVLMKLLQHISSVDYSAYQNILFESANVLPAEAEEEAFRWRNVRLEEKGFLPFDRAIGIYRPIDPGELLPKGAQTDPPLAQDQARTVALAPFAMIRSDSVFTHALANIFDENQRMRLQEEFAALCNQIIVADQKEVKKKEDLKPVVKKVCGYIAIGMEQLAHYAGASVDAADVLLQHPLTRLFQVGYGRIWEMKRRAKRWVKDSWFTAKGLPLAFWGEEWVGVLGGLLIKRPLFFDNYRTGVLYRDFESAAEISRSEKILNDVITCDRLYFLMDTGVSPDFKHTRLSYKNLLLTLWVNHCLGFPEPPALPSLDQFTAFYANLWEGKGKRRKIRDSMKTSFLDFLAQKTGLKDFEITAQAGGILEDLFLEIENEYAQVSVRHLDPRVMHLFLIGP